MVCPQIVSTDLDDLWLLCILGEAESTGTSERDMENSFLRNDAVFPPALCKHGQDRLCWLTQNRAEERGFQTMFAGHGNRVDRYDETHFYGF